MERLHCVFNDPFYLTMSTRVFHFLFPEVCVVCGKLLMPRERGCCSDCKEGFDGFTDARAAGHMLMHSICSHFGKGDALLGQASCHYRYYRHSPLQKALHAMKYEGNYTLCRAFGRELGEWISEVIPPESIDALVPVPLHRLKLIRITAGAMPERILLVDDVVTTGATVIAAAAALKKSGVLTVSLAALALTIKE